MLNKEHIRGFFLIGLALGAGLVGFYYQHSDFPINFLSHKAKTPLVIALGEALKTSISVTKSEREILHVMGDFFDIDHTGIANVKFNASGYPVGVSADGHMTLEEIKDKGVFGHDACSEIIQYMVLTTGASIIPADEKGKCKYGDFCAKSTGNNMCVYTYRKTNERIIYNAQNGTVKY